VIDFSEVSHRASPLPFLRRLWELALFSKFPSGSFRFTATSSSSYSDPDETRFVATSFSHWAAFLARHENLYGVSQSPPSQFICYRDPCRVAFFLHPRHCLWSFYGSGIKACVLFSSRRRTSHGNWFNEQGGMRRALLMSPTLLLSRARKSYYRMGNSAFKLASLSQVDGKRDRTKR